MARFLRNLFSFPTRRSSDLPFFQGICDFQSSLAFLLLSSLPHKVHAYLQPVIYGGMLDQKSTRLNSSHVANSYAVFLLKKKKTYKYYFKTQILNKNFKKTIA